MCRCSMRRCMQTHCIGVGACVGVRACSLHACMRTHRAGVGVGADAGACALRYATYRCGGGKLPNQSFVGPRQHHNPFSVGAAVEDGGLESAVEGVGTLELRSMACLQVRNVCVQLEGEERGGGGDMGSDGKRKGR